MTNVFAATGNAIRLPTRVWLTWRQPRKTHGHRLAVVWARTNANGMQHSPRFVRKTPERSWSAANATM
jgi:hypothetical protein